MKKYEWQKKMFFCFLACNSAKLRHPEYKYKNQEFWNNNPGFVLIFNVLSSAVFIWGMTAFPQKKLHRWNAYAPWHTAEKIFP